MRHPNEIEWTGLLADDLPWLVSWRMRRHIRCCATCQSHLLELRTERDRFRAAPERMAEAQALWQRRPLAVVARRRPLSFALGMGALAASAAVLLMVVLPDTRTPVDARLSAKGGDLFTMFVETARGPVPLGAECRPGDRMRAHVRSDNAHFLLLHLGDHDEVEALWPENGVSMSLTPGRAVDSPRAWELDAQGERERFVAVFSETPLRATQVGAWLTGAGQRPPHVTIVDVACAKSPGAAGPEGR